jgi:hypothetical protein
MNDFKYLVSSPEVKRAKRNDRRIKMAINIIGPAILLGATILFINLILG